MMVTTMDERPDMLAGLARMRARRRRYWLLLTGCIALLAVDLGFLWSNGDMPHDFEHIPHDMALGLACGYALGVAIGIVFMIRNGCDEHEARARRFGMTVAFSAFLAAYPFWAILAQAAVAPPVSTFALWAAAFVLYLACYGWRKYR